MSLTNTVLHGLIRTCLSSLLFGTCLNFSLFFYCFQQVFDIILLLTFFILISFAMAYWNCIAEYCVGTILCNLVFIERFKVTESVASSDIT